MTSQPRMLALTPAYNAEAFLRRTLDSLATPTYPSLRVLIADDASTDATADIAEDYLRRDARFSLVRRTNNLGWTGNTNACCRIQAGTPTTCCLRFMMMFCSRTMWRAWQRDSARGQMLF